MLRQNPRTAPLFKATERFDPSDGDRWQKYIEWAKIPALTEIVGLDGMLCPTLLAEIEHDDWNHIVNESFRLDYFYDLDYLLGRVAGLSRRNILGLYRNPEAHIDLAPAAGGFEFLGYELIEEMTQISALTNCGGFPNSFSNVELNNYWLICEFTRACAVRKSLALANPDEPHAQCEMYAIWRLNEKL